MRLYIAAFLLVFLAQAHPVFAQTINFDVLLFGEKIGHLTVTRKMMGDSTESYTLESRSKASVLWIKRENYTRYDVVYQNNRLISSENLEIENGKKKRWVNVFFDGKHYQVNGYKGKRILNEVPTFSVVKLFFTETPKQNRLFYESEGDFADIKHPKPNVCEFTASDGSRNIYFYQNGRLSNVETHVSIASIKLVRTN